MAQEMYILAIDDQGLINLLIFLVLAAIAAIAKALEKAGQKKQKKPADMRSGGRMSMPGDARMEMPPRSQARHDRQIPPPRRATSRQDYTFAAAREEEETLSSSMDEIKLQQEMEALDLRSRQLRQRLMETETERKKIQGKLLPQQLGKLKEQQREIALVLSGLRLDDPVLLRQAFVFKEVLSPPLSLRREPSSWET